MDTDVLIIGAGLLGCAAARSLCQYELRVTVLEKAPDVCTGISKANSGILYPGYDTAPGSFKTELTLRAGRHLEALCRDLDVRYRKTGSLMAGYGERSETVIRRKYENGQKNKVRGLALLNGREILELEPLLAPGARLGLYSPDTATIHPWELCIALYENAAANGAEFHRNSEVRAIRRIPNGFAVDTADRTWTARTVINCAGLAADRVHDLLEAPKIRLVPKSADYFLLDIPEQAAPSHVIFHEPEYKGKGLTLIPTVDGNLLVGPTERAAADRAGSPVAEEGIEALRKLCRDIVPSLPLNPILHAFGSARPNPFEARQEPTGEWVTTDRSLKDFNILEEDGFYSLIGIKTPGLTCSTELGNYLAEQIRVRLGDVPENRSFVPTRRAIPRTAEMSVSERAGWIAGNPDYGRIICSCRGISEGAIREAIRRGAVTLDGVKRRTGALMGYCQGSRCTGEILRILASELGCSPYEILKEHPGSGILQPDQPDTSLSTEQRTEQ